MGDSKDKLPDKNLPFAKRSLGQNFLSDQNYIKKVIDSLTLVPGDQVVEIGPGRGALTEFLVASGARVTAIELDRNLIPLLNEKFNASDSFDLIEQNALEVDFLSLSESKNQTLKLVANLPYYISTAILQHLIEHRHAFSDMVLMFQREVVDRITAQSGNSDRGFLTVLIEAHLDVERLFDVPPTAFRPVPKVWSSVTRLSPKSGIGPPADVFRNLVSSAFRQPRKTILNNLKAAVPNAAMYLAACEIEPTLRPERLSLPQWLCLAAEFQRSKYKLDSATNKRRKTDNE